MAITITHPTRICGHIIFDNKSDYVVSADLDELTEMACDIMVKRNFHIAIITDNHKQVYARIERS